MADARAQAISLEYVLGIAVAVVLVGGLFVAGGNFVSDQQHTAARAELQVIGQQVAADVEAADRLAAAGAPDPTVRVRRDLPRAVTGAGYRIELLARPDPVLRLNVTRPAVGVTVEFHNYTDVGTSRVVGGPVIVNRTEAGTIALESGGR